MPRYIVQKSPGVPGLPIPSDEPCLVIRAQDMLALEMMRHYLNIAINLPIDDDIIFELEEHYSRLREWRRVNADKIKLPDR